MLRADPRLWRVALRPEGKRWRVTIERRDGSYLLSLLGGVSAQGSVSRALRIAYRSAVRGIVES